MKFSILLYYYLYLPNPMSHFTKIKKCPPFLFFYYLSGIVDTLFKGVSGKGTSDQLCKSMEQALYCLYAHPSKKSKARHLVDHGISNIAFTWDRCLKPYLYLRPKKLPEYDDLKSASVISETVVFFRRIWYVYNIFSYFSFLLLLKCCDTNVEKFYQNFVLVLILVQNYFLQCTGS